jgi:2-oxoglutarate ferredoxin oxidoreductase subunit alpha
MSIAAQPSVRSAAAPATPKEKGWFASNWGLVAATAALIIILIIPTPADLPVAGHRMLAILAFAVILWMTEAVDYGVSAILIAALMAFLLGLAPNVANPPPGIAKSKGRMVPLAMSDPHATRLERGLHGKRVNMFAAGLVGALIGLDAGHVEAAITTIFEGKGDEVLAANRKGAAGGAAAAASLTLNTQLDPPKPASRWLISGNQAVAYGALRGGVRFVGCYPITPATDLVEWLAPHMLKLGGRLALGEDELASVNMALGASYGGTPAMTVTSGPGFSLMVESLGLAIAAEVPLVLIDVMRTGPSTGIASKTEQSDINLAIYGAHGDAPRVVLAPISVADCITTGEYAVYVAESLQTPVIVLSDQALGQATTVIDPSAERPKPLTRAPMVLRPANLSSAMPSAPIR